MKHRNILLAVMTVAISTLLPLQTQAINKQTPLYMFGFGMSLNDSTVYLTEIQHVDSAWVDTKTGFLYSRENYSDQLRRYLQEEAGIAHPTSVVLFAEKRKNIEKKYLKFKKRYAPSAKKRQKKNINYILKNIDPTAFSFTHITPDTPEARYTAEELKEAIKKEKAELKEAKKKAAAKAKADKLAKKEARVKAMADAKQRAKELKKK